MTIGQKGMLVAAKALAITAADLFSNPQLVQDAKKFLSGEGFLSGIGDALEELLP